MLEEKYHAAAVLKASNLMSDLDILVDVLEYPEDEAKKRVDRMKIQKLEELKLQIIAKNPFIDMAIQDLNNLKPESSRRIS